MHLTFDMRIGGAEQVISTLVRGADKKQFDVGVLCLEKNIGPIGAKLIEDRYSLQHFDRRPGFDVSMISQIRKMIRSQEIDILHCHQYSPYVYGVLAATGTRCKVIFTEHGRFFPDHRKLKRILSNPFLCRLTDVIIAISAATKEALVAYENFPRNKIQIVYNGIEASHYSPSADEVVRQSLGIPKNASVLGTVARLDPIKNQAMMIRALALIQQRHPRTYLLIVGDGPERNALADLATRLGVAEHVLFTGFRSDVHRYYPLMDIFLLTSFSEGTAMTLLEAMAASRPCVVSDVGGNPEIVNDGETGFVIPSNDVQALVSTIERLLDDDILLDRIGRAGCRRFQAQFTAERMVRSYEALYMQ